MTLLNGSPNRPHRSRVSADILRRHEQAIFTDEPTQRNSPSCLPRFRGSTTPKTDLDGKLARRGERRRSGWFGQFLTRSCALSLTGPPFAATVAWRWLGQVPDDECGHLDTADNWAPCASFLVDQWVEIARGSRRQAAGYRSDPAQLVLCSVLDRAL